MYFVCFFVLSEPSTYGVIKSLVLVMCHDVNALFCCVAVTRCLFLQLWHLIVEMHFSFLNYVI